MPMIVVTWPWPFLDLWHCVGDGCFPTGNHVLVLFPGGLWGWQCEAMFRDAKSDTKLCVPFVCTCDSPQPAALWLTVLTWGMFQDTISSEFIYSVTWRIDIKENCSLHFKYFTYFCKLVPLCSSSSLPSSEPKSISILQLMHTATASSVCQLKNKSHSQIGKFQDWWCKSDVEICRRYPVRDAGCIFFWNRQICQRVYLTMTVIMTMA